MADATQTLTFKLIIDGKEATATLEVTDKGLKKVAGSSQDVTDKMSKWGNIVTGFNQSIEIAQRVVGVLKQTIMDAATIKVMRDNFEGTAEEIELFRQATARTVSEGNLIRLSNQATDLGLSIKDQALFFALSENAADKLGVSVEEAFQKIVYASEGNIRGLKQIGIQATIYNKIVNDMLKAQGESLATIDPEALKRIRLDAVIKASGITLDDVKNKTQDQKDKLEALGVTVQESKEKFGELINSALVPLISSLTNSGDASKVMVGGVVSITSFVVPLIPIIGQLKTAQALLATQSLATAGAIDAEALAAKGLLATLALPVVIGTGLGVGAGMLIDYLKDQHEKTGKDKTYFENQQAENSKNLAWMNNKRFVPGEGTYTLVEKDVSTTAKKTVEDIEKDIAKLQNQRKGLVAGSKELLDLDKQIEKLSASITYKKSDPKQVNNLAQEVVKTEELKGKLEQIKTLKDESLSQFEKEKLLAEEDYQAKLKAFDAEIAAIKKVAAEKKEKLGSDDLQKIVNANIGKQLAEGEFNQKIIDLNKKHNEDQLTLQNDYEQSRMQIEGKADLEILANKKEFYQALSKLENDPEKKKELQRKIDLLDAEMNKMQLDQIGVLNQAKIDALIDYTDIQKDIKNKAATEEWYRLQKESTLYKTNADYKSSIDKQYLNKSMDLYRKAFLAKLNTYSQLTDAWQNAFGQIYSAMEMGARDEINLWKTKEEKKLDQERESALKHARTQAQREKINKQYDKRQGQLEDEANKKAQEKLGIWFKLKQLGDIGLATMSTYKAANAALEPPPAGLGPVFGWPLMAAVILGGLANVAIIAQQKIPGYKKGGAIVGEDGPEIIAPFQDYAAGQSKLIAMTMMTLKEEMRSSRSSSSLGSSSNADYREVKEALTELNKQLKGGISARAYLDDREAKKVNSRGGYLNRRSKL